MFENHILIKYEVKNKQPEWQLQGIKAEVKHSGMNFKVEHLVPIKQLAPGQSADYYVGLSRLQDCEEILAEEKFSTVLKFTVKELVKGEVKATYPDELALESFQLKLADYFSSIMIAPDDFSKVWTSTPGEQLKGTFQLKYASTQAASIELIKHYGLSVVQTTEASANSNFLTIQLAGKYLQKDLVLIVLMLAFDTKMGCLLKFMVKTGNGDLGEELMQSIQ